MFQRKYLSVQPNNVPSTGKVSFARGNPILTITLGRQDAMLDLSSLRLSGDLNIWRDAAGTLHPTDAAAAELRGSHKLGIYSVIDQLVFRHAETKQVIEHIRHYGRFMASYMPVMAGSQDVAGHLGETALIYPNYQAYRDSVIRNTAASPFCIPLPSGLTLGADKLPLSKLPLEIEIHLAPDSQVFYSSDATTANVANAFYELSGLEVACEVEYGVPAPDTGVLSFNSITSYFSTLESTNSIINFNLGLSKVLGSFVNFVPANFVNNLAQDGFLTYMPTKAPNAAGTGGGAVANLESISFLRNGERFPSPHSRLSRFVVLLMKRHLLIPKLLRVSYRLLYPKANTPAQQFHLSTPTALSRVIKMLQLVIDSYPILVLLMVLVFSMIC